MLMSPVRPVKRSGRRSLAAVLSVAAAAAGVLVVPLDGAAVIRKAPRATTTTRAAATTTRPTHRTTTTTRAAPSPTRRPSRTTTTRSRLTAATPATTGPGRFGIASGALLFSAPDATFNADLDAIQGFGARWLRTPLKWQNVELKGKGLLNWRVADRLVDGATSRGLNLVLTINATPSWALPPGTTDPSYPPVNLVDYADFARAAVTRYHDRVHVWELGNEPNHSTGWMPAPDPARYAQLLKLTYQAIMGADPTAKVLTGGIGG